MAIAYDNSTYNTVASGTSNTFSHTVGAGSDRALFVGVYGYAASCTGVTYNGVAMTKITEINNPTLGSYLSVWYLVNPASGANNVVATVASSAQIQCVASSYTGVSGTPIDSSASSYLNDTAASITLATTVVASNCWLAGWCIIDNGVSSTPSALTSSRTNRQAGGVGPYYRAYSFADSNATVATGSQSVQSTDSTSGTRYKTAIVFSIAPYTAPATAGSRAALTGAGK